MNADLTAHVEGARDGIPGVIVCGCGWEMAAHKWREHLQAVVREAALAP